MHYLKRHLLLIGLLGFFSGLPLALTASTLTAWLSEASIDRTTIGLFAAVATPYAFKFLWAPLIDGVRIPLLHRLGRRRSWLFLTQLFLTFAVLLMGFSNPETGAALTALAAVFVAAASATQDIVIDAYRVERLKTEEQGKGAAMSTFGYRMGMLTSGAGALALADTLGWQSTYLIMALIVASSLALTLLAREPGAPASPSRERRNIREWMRAYVIAPFGDFMKRPLWWQVLMFVILYKLGDAFLGAMFNPFLLELGFSKTTIAEIVKLYGLIATLLGTFIGGWLVSHWGMYRSLFICGLGHMLTNLLLIELARRGADSQFLIISIALENITGGMSLAAFVAYLSALCKVNYTATQYALLSALAAFGRTWLSTPSGWVATSLGWQGFFLISTLLSLPSLALLWYLKRRAVIT